MAASTHIVTRFAPSPTGRLHLGHAFSALFAADAARRGGGTFLLRIEDIDASRCRPAFVDAIYEDLAWLGLAWPTPVRVQSQHFADYRAALERLQRDGLVYPCFCTRAEIAAEAARAGAAPHEAEMLGPPYPGTCRRLSVGQRAERMARGDGYALRLDAGMALAQTGQLAWHDRARGLMHVDPAHVSDVVLARKDTPTSYHLSVTCDDHLQRITLVTRGEDLFHATHLHRVLQALLGLATPDYHHHKLLTDEHGRRFAKRDAAATLASLRANGTTAAELRARLGFD
ncbi:MAG: tRNA glutamyl-Q(34) synthetase GluQRS [Alphaproteobacteria bacterium]